MAIGVMFWVIMIILAFFGWMDGSAPGPAPGTNWGRFRVYAVILVLFALLGWQVFGPVLHR